jgi:phenylalanyl-tRNA synthetase beta subunit
MLISYKWLQGFFGSPLPSPEELVATSNLKMVEVEGVEEKEGDTIIDLKILADRAAYMLSHEGVAREFSATLGLPLGGRQVPAVKSLGNVGMPEVKVESELCRRYTARRVRPSGSGVPWPR